MRQRRVLALSRWRSVCYAAFATYLSMFFICSAQPSSFLRKASRRKSPGILSKPDSVSTSNVSVAVLSNLNSTSVVGSFEVVRRVLRLGQGLRMRPGEAEQPFGLHFLYDRLPFDMFVARVRDLAT